MEPELLEQFRRENPDSDWKKGFKGNAGVEANNQVKNALIRDQKGLCAYCEIDLKCGNGQALDDFRVEHFFPENPAVPRQFNYALDWNNLLGCCSGGNSKSVVDSAQRFTKPDFSCDVPKANHDWTNEILNPLDDIPVFPCLFSFDENKGEILVNSQNSEGELKRKAENSITFLNLNANRLVKFRKAVFEELAEQISKYIVEFGEDETLSILADTYFSIDGDEMYPAFYTAIRWYLGDMAEIKIRGLET